MRLWQSLAVIFYYFCTCIISARDKMHFNRYPGHLSSTTKKHISYHAVMHHNTAVLVLAGWQFSRLFNCGSVSGPFWQKIGLVQRARFKKRLLRATPLSSRQPSRPSCVWPLAQVVLYYCSPRPNNILLSNQPLRTCQHPANAGKEKHEWTPHLPNKSPTSYQNAFMKS